MDLLMVYSMETSYFDKTQYKRHYHEGWQNTSSNAGHCVVTNKATLNRHVHWIIMPRGYLVPVVKDVEMIHFKNRFRPLDQKKNVSRVYITTIWLSLEIFRDLLFASSFFPLVNN